MSRPFVVAVAVVLLAMPVVAQDVPSTALEGQGQSTQTLDLVQDAVVVTIDAGGSFSSKSGEGDGGLSVDINGLTVGVGSDPAEAASGLEGKAGGVAEHASADPVVQADNATKQVPALLDADGVCSAALGEAMSPAAIAQLGSGSTILLQPVCDTAGLDPASRQAVADNGALSAYLAARNVAISALVSITILRDAVVVSYASAN